MTAGIFLLFFYFKILYLSFIIFKMSYSILVFSTIFNVLGNINSIALIGNLPSNSYFIFSKS